MYVGPSSLTVDKDSKISEEKTPSSTEKIAGSILGTGKTATSTIGIERSDLPPAQIAHSIVTPIFDQQLICSYEIKENVVHFFPIKENYTLQLDSTQTYFDQYWVAASLSFSGTIDKKRFIAALARTLADFDFVFGRIKSSKLVYSKEDHVELEINECDKTLSEFKPEELLPNRSEEQRSLKPSEMDAAGKFKLTITKDGFTFSWCKSHAFFDQSSICYFMKYLSRLYTHNTSLTKPSLFFANSLLSESDKVKDLEEFKDLSKKHGILHLSEIGTFIQQFANQEPVVFEPVTLRISENYLKQLAQKSPSFVSINDLIHAFYCKAFASGDKFEGHEEVWINYACNLRKEAGLSDNAIGNVIRTRCFKITVEEIRNLSITELAIKNRENHAKREPASLIDLLRWREGLRQLGLKKEDYVFENYLAPFIVFMTNWTTGFDYDKIAFDSATPITIRAPMNGNKIAGVLFEYIEGERQVLVPMEIPSGQFDITAKKGKEIGFELLK